jgi:hypothetical protein
LTFLVDSRLLFQAHDRLEEVVAKPHLVVQLVEGQRLGDGIEPFIAQIGPHQRRVLLFDEAFRLTNVGDSPVDLNAWDITDEEGIVALDGSLEAGASIWLTGEAAYFTQESGVCP